MSLGHPALRLVWSTELEHPHHADAMSRGADCTRCPLYGVRRGPVPSQITPGAKVAISGEQPGPTEVENWRNFDGFSGRVLDEALIIGGLNRSEQTVINVISCMAPENADDGFEEWLKREARRAKREGREFVSPIDCCRKRFERDLDDTGAEVLLAVGKFALSSMESYLRDRGWLEADAEELVMARVHGAPINLNTVDVADASAVGYGVRAPSYLFASYHPAYANRDPKWHRFVKANIVRAASVAVRGWIDWSEPAYAIAPSLEWIVAWIRWARENNIETGIDLETCDKDQPWKPSADIYTCDIRCIGTGVRVRVASGRLNEQGVDEGAMLESVVVVPIRHMDGTYWQWTDADRSLAVSLARSHGVDESVIQSYVSGGADGLDALVRWVLYREYALLFDKVSVVGHNISTFDSEIMLRVGLMTDRTKPSIDTMLMHHNTRAQDMPHTLSFLGRQEFEVPAWKTKEDLTSTDNADDEKLFVRCARDVLVCLRGLERLRVQLVEDGTQPQQDVDTALAVIERNAGSRGLCVDERERGFWSRVLGRESAKLLNRWHELVGKDVNPRSPQQMQELLYRDWKLEVPVTTTGDTWDPEKDGESDFDDDEGSTGVEAIIALLRFDERGFIELGHDAGTRARRRQALDALLEYKALDKPLTTYVHMPVREWPSDRWSQELVNVMLDAEGALDRRPAISRLRPIPSMGRTPVGRSAWKKSAEQQRPKQGRNILLRRGEIIPPGITIPGEVKTKTKEWGPAPCDVWISANMRRIIRAAPGHVLVGSDYKSSHIRIYTAAAQDLLLYDIIFGGIVDERGNKIDPHSFNAATILTENEHDRWIKYSEIEYASKEIREYWRFVSKKDCIAEGSLVLTDRGLVPIENVTLDHRLWDGVEWVTHQGVIDKGVRDVIEYDGLTATPDHKVWLEDGSSTTFGTAAREGRKLARSGRGRQPLPFLGNDVRSVEGTRPPQGESEEPHVESHPKTARVYDILNAGPRHRFTVSDMNVSNCFSTIYGAIPQTKYEVMRTERRRDTGKLAFPNISLKDCENFYERWHYAHPWTAPWQKAEIEKFERRGYAVAEVEDWRRRFGPLEHNQIPNHAILSFEGSIHKRALRIIEANLPGGVESEWTGIVYDGHDSVVAQCLPHRESYVKELLDFAMRYEWNGVVFEGESRQINSLGDL